MARRAAELAQYAYETTGEYWPAHAALMKRGPSLRPEDFDAVATDLGLPPTDGIHQEVWRLAQNKVQEDIDARGAAAREFRRHSSSTTAAMNGSGTEARSRKPCLAPSVIACRPRRWISRDGRRPLVCCC